MNDKPKAAPRSQSVQAESRPAQAPKPHPTDAQTALQQSLDRRW